MSIGLRRRRGLPTALLALTLLAGACTGDSDESAESAEADQAPPPSVDDATAEVAPADGNALRAVVSVDVGEPARVEVTATSADHEVVVPVTEEAPEHEIPLLGLRADTDYQVEVALVGGDEEVPVGEGLPLRSGPLPGDLPSLEVVSANPEDMAGGVTLFNLLSFGAPGVAPSEPVPGYLVAVDAAGEVVWYQSAPYSYTDARQLENGNILTSYTDLVALETDMLGNTVRGISSEAGTEPLGFRPDDPPPATPDAVVADIDSVHHELGTLPNGNWILLDTELRELTGPPQCGEPGPTATYNVVGDVVVEMDPDSGEVVNEWSMFDYYDPFERPGSDFCTDGPPLAPPNFFYPEATDIVDWTHGNGVVLDEERNALIISLRHLDATLAIRYEDDDDGPAGEFLWELGPDGTLPLTEGEPPYHQHAPEVQADGTLLLYDNGNDRPGVPPEELYSRAVIYEIDDTDPDPANWTATQVWEHRVTEADGTPVYAAFLCDADRVDNGNVLITHGAIPAEGGLYARIIEVEQEGAAGGDVVWDLRVGEAEKGWTVYRAERLPSLYG